MDSEVSLGLPQCRINIGTGLECIEPARLLITARKPYLGAVRKLHKHLGVLSWSAKCLFYQIDPISKHAYLVCLLGPK